MIKQLCIFPTVYAFVSQQQTEDQARLARHQLEVKNMVWSLLSRKDLIAGMVSGLHTCMLTSIVSD